MTGEILWTCGGFIPNQRSIWRTIALATLSSGIAIVPQGMKKYITAEKNGGKSDITESARLWEKNGIGIDVAHGYQRWKNLYR